MVIFLQGCKLKCRYCHNPDTISTTDGTLHSIESLVDRAVRMKPYFADQGGVTVSGGEPLLQAKNLITLFKRLQEEGIHTNLDTNGRIMNHFSEELSTLADLVMLDIKHPTEEGYQDITGKKNKDIALRFAAMREEQGRPMWLRYVLIPGITNTPENLHILGQHFKDYRSVTRVELLPYHKLGVHKWEALGWEYTMKDTPENTEEELAMAREILSAYFTDIVIN